MASRSVVQQLAEDGTGMDKLLNTGTGAFRFPRSHLHQRDPRASSSLFDAYGGDSRAASQSPAHVGGGTYGGYAGDGGYRSATPNKKCVCSRSVIDWLMLGRH